ncbi:MAG: asparagine synthase, partial [Proteobacteria bacterium]|nr:asparagine synthase [Pseudomonadota bacterium]
MTHTNNTQENLEAVFYNLLAEGHRSDAAYDCLVLFSGGKDSTYMAHMLKLARGGRVCLFSVDNGFEAKSHFDFLKAGATKLKMDLYLYQPPFEEFVTYYNFLLTEDLLKSFDSNPLCFFCARYFMALGLEFADRM